MSKEDVKLNMKNLYEGSTKNVFKSVILGKAVAGATLDVEFEKEAADIISQVRVIMRTKDIASHPVSAHPRVPAQVRDNIARSILALSKKADMEIVLRDVKLPKPVVADYDKDYRELEEIDIEKLNAER